MDGVLTSGVPLPIDEVAPLSSSVFLAVIGAALLHASWNALVKGGDDKRANMGAVVLGHLPFAIAVLPFVPTPSTESLPFVVTGVGLHLGYQLFLIRAYELGDLSQVYPLARGSAPLVVALLSVTVMGVRLAPLELLGVLVIGAGIVSLTLVRGADGQKNSAAAATALITGCFIALYSINDGLGARLAGTSLGFYSWLAIGNGIAMWVYLAFTASDVLREIPRKRAHVVLLGGGGSFGAYAVVTWAFTQAPIALVTALRETSIVFALLIGAVAFKERLDLARLAATFATLLGAALIRFAR